MHLLFVEQKYGQTPTCHSEYGKDVGKLIVEVKLNIRGE